MEMHDILCAVDFSDFSRRALDHALTVARCYGSTVTVLHVVAPMPTTIAGPYYLATAPSLPAQLDLARATRDVEQFVASERVPGVRIETVVAESADVYHEILTQADQLKATLLVLGTHGRSGFERLFLGSTAEKVLRKARCPVMTVPPGTPDAMERGSVPFTRIVCATDFSDHALPAVDFALSLARDSNAALTLTHIIDTEPLYVDFTPPAVVALDAWSEDARHRLHELSRRQPRPSAPMDQVVRQGTPYREILALAAERGADLIVLGIRGRRAVDLLLFGSTAHHVVREAHCAVLTLRG